MIKGSIIGGVTGGHQPPNQRTNQDLKEESLLGNNSPLISPISVHLVIAFVPNYLFKDVQRPLRQDRNCDFLQDRGQICFLINKIKIVCPCRAKTGQVCQQTLLKTGVSSAQGSLVVTNPLYVWHQPGSISTSSPHRPQEHRGQGELIQN